LNRTETNAASVGSEKEGERGSEKELNKKEERRKKGFEGID